MNWKQFFQMRRLVKIYRAKMQTPIQLIYAKTN